MEREPSMDLISKARFASRAEVNEALVWMSCHQIFEYKVAFYSFFHKKIAPLGLSFNGARDEARTRDPFLGKEVFYH